MKTKLLLFLLCVFSMVNAQTRWDFTENTEGWIPYGDDVATSHSGSNLVVTYTGGGDGAYGYPTIYKDVSIEAATIDKFYMKFTAHNWVKTSVLVNILFETNSGNYYANQTMTVANGELTFDIRDGIQYAWNKLPASGTITRIRIEIPHNSESGTPSDWNGATLDIDSIVFSKLDIIAPILSNVTVGPVTSGDNISVTSNENANLYLVPAGTAKVKADILATAVATASAIVDVAATLNTTGLALGNYIVYAIDADSNVSDASASITISAADITTPQQVVWNFAASTEGWIPYGDDVATSHSGSNLVVTYTGGGDGAYGYPTIYKDVSIEAATIDKFYMKFTAHNWVKTSALVNIIFYINGTEYYANQTMTVANGELTFDIRDGIQYAWNKLPASGTITQIRIQIPHNSESGTPSDWNGATLDIDSIVFSKLDIIAPVLSNVTVGPVTSGDNISVTSNEDANVYLVPEGTAKVKATILAAALITIPATATVAVNLITTGLTAGNYIVYAIDADDNVSDASASITISAPLYVYSGNGLLSDTANWSPQPPSLTATNSTYSIPSSATTNFTWVLGSGSKIIVGDGISAANFTIDPLYSCTGGSIDVSAGATLTVAHATSPTLGTLNATSTVEYTAVTAAIPSSKTFGNLKVTGATSVATQASAVTIVAGNFTLSNGAIYKIDNASSGSNLSIAGDFNVSGAGGITTTSILAAATSAALTLTGTGKNIDNTAIANDFVKLNVNINGTYNLANDFKYNTTLSSARLFTIGASGSLNLNGKKLSLDNNGSIANTLGGTFTANGSGSTVEYFGDLPQAIPTILYHNLVLSGASKTIPAGLSIANDLTLDGPNAAIAAGDVVVNNNLTVGLLGSVTVSAGKNLTVKNALINNATTGAAAVVIESGANLVQGAATTVDTNAGNITVKRNSNALHRLDYTIWSSPVAGAQTLADFSPLTSQSPNRFFNFDSSGNQFTATAFASPFVSGTGYLIRMPNTDLTTNYDAGTAPLSFLGVFVGKPNNGTINVPTVASKYNGVGNPYPSVIDADLFKASNPDINTLYFWRKTNNPDQGTSPTTSYASYNITSATGTGVAPDGAALGEPTITPDKYIQVGQGFLFETAQTSVVFNNAMRVANNGNKFLKTKQIERSRIWLNLSNTSWPINQMALCYMDGALLGLDETDSKYINDSSVALTSNIENGEYIIQGRPTFNATDVVALNFKTNAAGDYTIAIDHTDGVFATGQDVYLLDSKTGVETALKAGAYTFNATAGVDNARFSLKYQKTLKVDASVFNENSVRVYKSNGTLYVNSGNVAISNIKVFDLQGRLIAEQKNLKSTAAKIKDLKANHQVLIVKITGEDNSVVTKKVVN